MKRWLAVLVTTLCAAALPAQDSKELLGRWEPTQTSRGGLATIIEFREDRKFRVNRGTLVRGSYVIDSAKITFSFPGGVQPLIRGYEVKGDTLTVWSSQHPTYSMIRTAASQSRSGVVGEWASTNGDRTTYETLRADGTYRVWIPMAVDSSGEYLVRRNFVTIREGRVETRMMWRLNDVGLELQRDVNARGSVPSFMYVRERQ